MEDQDKNLGALTNQRVSITVAGKPYSVKRATLKDVADFNRYRFERTERGDIANLEMDSTLFLLTVLLKPDYDFTIDQLYEMIPFENYEDVIKALEASGFRLPQPKEKPAK